jgi:hypothetical protein
MSLRAKREAIAASIFCHFVIHDRAFALRTLTEEAYTPYLATLLIKWS